MMTGLILEIRSKFPIIHTVISESPSKWGVTSMPQIWSLHPDFKCYDVPATDGCIDGHGNRYTLSEVPSSEVSDDIIISMVNTNMDRWLEHINTDNFIEETCGVTLRYKDIPRTGVR